MNKSVNISKPLMWLMVLLLAAIVAGCGSGGTASTAKAITAYSINGISGVIDESAKTISVSVPTGTVVTALVSTFTTTGSSLSVDGFVQSSGVTSNNFSAAKTYIVAAADGTTATYTVTVTVAASSAKALTAYSLAGVTAVITEPAHAIAVTVPFGTNVTALIATFATSGSGVPTVGGVNQVSATTPNDFSSFKDYIVTAADTTTATYRVTVTVAAAAAGSGVCSGVNCVPLGTAANYAILAETLIATTVTAGTAITGDIGVSPEAATFIQGFSLTLDPTGCFSRPTPATLVTGNIYAADYNTNGCPTPTYLTTAVGDKLAAYNAAAAKPAGTGLFLDAGAGDIGGMDLTPGVYTWSGNPNVVIPASGVTLTGTATDVWVFQIPGTLTMNSAAVITLVGAKAKNIFWQVAGAVTIGTSAHMEGVVMSASSITLQTSATANSRLLSSTAVNLDSNAVTQPAP